MTTTHYSINTRKLLVGLVVVVVVVVVVVFRATTLTITHDGKKRHQDFQ
jgi:hypothetical protein